jgi:CubicO group peptidase (beta-lactamase class C family)
MVFLLAAPGPAISLQLVRLPPQPTGVPWPVEVWPEDDLPASVDAAALENIAGAAFAARGPGGDPDTRALLLVHRGRVVFERYAPGFHRDSRFQSWSMAKNVTQALIGILVRQGRLDLKAPADVPAWKSEGDPRGAITLDDLLHMSSGLDNADGEERERSLVAELLFGRGSADMAAFGAAFPLTREPGTHWAYSTATSMIVADIAGRTIGGGREGILDFMHRELFDPLGMRSAVPEFDASGHFAGGVFMHASARDYARFGLLFLRDGVWGGRRILPGGWVDYTRTPAPAANNGTYGAHFWLNYEPGPDQFANLPGGPESAFSVNGASGQFIMLIPTHDLILVRLGELHSSSEAEISGTLAEIVKLFPPLAAERR